jgi:hypothetical protein
MDSAIFYKLPSGLVYLLQARDPVDRSGNVNPKYVVVQLVQTKCKVRIQLKSKCYAETVPPVETSLSLSPQFHLIMRYKAQLQE